MQVATWTATSWAQGHEKEAENDRSHCIWDVGVWTHFKTMVDYPTLLLLEKRFLCRSHLHRELVIIHF